jgi:hypothetical protein
VLSVLTTEPNCVQRIVKEVIVIINRKPSLNKDGEYEFPPVYDLLLSRFDSK